MAKERELKWAKEAAEEAQKNETAAEDENTEENEAIEKTEEENVQDEAEGTQTEIEQEDAGEGSADDGFKDKYQRLFAEFDNFRKRTEKEKAMRFDLGARNIVEKILPVVDSLELAIKNVPENDKDNAFVDGMEKIHKQFLKVLEEVGVTPIDALGKEFDPEYHNAVMHVEDEEAGDNIVVEELQKGYMYKDHVVRYSMVKVAN